MSLMITKDHNKLHYDEVREGWGGWCGGETFYGRHMALTPAEDKFIDSKRNNP